MSSVQVLDFQGHPVRMLELGGQPWWVLRDICEVLGLTTPARVAERLDEDEVSQTHITDGIGRQQDTTIVSESGLYAVILRSDKPLAKPFRKWVTAEVLPQIRKTGAYIPEAPAQAEGEIYLRTGRVMFSQKCKVCMSSLALDINRMLDEGQRYDDIVEWAATHGLSISKGGLSRHNHAHRVPQIAERSLLENPEIAARIMLAKLTEIAQRRSLDGLSDREVVKYQTALATSLGRDGGGSRALPYTVPNLLPDAQ